MTEYVTTDYVLCCKAGHPKGGQWYRGKDCPMHPRSNEPDQGSLVVIEVNPETGVITMGQKP